MAWSSARVVGYGISQLGSPPPPPARAGGGRGAELIHRLQPDRVGQPDDAEHARSKAVGYRGRRVVGVEPNALGVAVVVDGCREGGIDLGAAPDRPEQERGIGPLHLQAPALQV